MRKLFSLILTIAFIFALALPASAGTQKASFAIGQASYTADGQTRPMDAMTFSANDRTYVPVRYLGYALGLAEDQVEWDGRTNTVSLGPAAGKTVRLTLGSKTLTVVGGQAVAMDAAPLARSGRIYLPARFVAEAFGYHVGWDSSTQTVRVSRDALEPNKTTDEDAAAPTDPASPIASPIIEYEIIQGDS